MLGRGALVFALSAFGLGVIPPGIAGSAGRPSRRAATSLDQRSISGAYKGHTSQHQPVTFTISSGKVRKLAFWIVIGCKSHHHYRLRASGFAPIPIHSGEFALLVRSQHPAAGAAVVGKIRHGNVTGSVHLTRYVRAEHGPCSGAASYTAHH